MGICCRIQYFFTVSLCLVFCSLYCQPGVAYHPRKKHDASSRELIHAVRAQLDDELSTIKSKRKFIVSKIYTHRTNNLVMQITGGAFLKDDSLQQFVDDVFHRLVSFNSLRHTPRRVLILSDPVVNAYCFGEGTFFVTVGLLSKIDNEAQLAFAIAHELAHYELDHVRNGIVNAVENNLAKKTAREVNKIMSGDITLEEIAALRELLYGVSRFSREMEMQADSLGFIYFQRAQYNPAEALSLLSVLDSAQHPKYSSGHDLFLPLHAANYPFQEYWLNQRLSIYSKRPTNVLFFSTDSVQTHPQIAARKERLLPQVQHSSQLPVNYQPESFIHEVVRVSEFESVEAAYFSKQYDRCLFLALQLKSVYPQNPYLVSMISKVFVDLCDARNKGMLEIRLPRYTSHYSESLRSVNNFLHNLTEEEMIEVAYHFLNNRSNFNSDEEEHYYLLWKLCDLSRRLDVQEKIRQAYRDKFRKGTYYSKMK